MSSTWREDKFYYLCSRQIAKLIIQSIKLLFILPIVRDDMVQNSIKILIFVGGVEPPHYVLIFCILLEYIIHYLYHHILKFYHHLILNFDFQHECNAYFVILIYMFVNLLFLLYLIPYN